MAGLSGWSPTGTSPCGYSPKIADPLTTRIGDICSGEPVVLGPDDDVEQASRLIRERAVRRIPVLADGTPVGVVSIADLALDLDATSALSGISAASPNS